MNLGLCIQLFLAALNSQLQTWARLLKSRETLRAAKMKDIMVKLFSTECYSLFGRRHVNIRVQCCGHLLNL